MSDQRSPALSAASAPGVSAAAIASCSADPFAYASITWPCHSVADLARRRRATISQETRPTTAAIATAIQNQVHGNPELVLVAGCGRVGGGGRGGWRGRAGGARGSGARGGTARRGGGRRVGGRGRGRCRRRCIRDRRRRGISRRRRGIGSRRRRRRGVSGADAGGDAAR